MKPLSAISIVIVPALIAPCGCAKKPIFLSSPVPPAPSMAPPPAPQYPEPVAEPFAPPAPPAVTGGKKNGPVELAAGVDSSKPAGERILIYTARLQVSTPDVDAALGTAQKLCADSGGYMDALTTQSITMRVPARKFFDVLEQTKKLGQVLSRDINAQDVTDEYVDLQLRLKNAEATRDRLVAILQQAQTVKDTLEVERELNRVRDEIERIKGRLAVLDRQTAFSTITIQFARPAPVQVERQRPPTPFPWLDSLGVEHVLQLDH